MAESHTSEYTENDEIELDKCVGSDQTNENVETTTPTTQSDNNTRIVKWRRHEVTMKIPRYCHTAVAVSDDRTITTGGANDQGETLQTCEELLFVSNTSDSSFLRRNQSLTIKDLPIGLVAHASVYHDNHLYVMGGSIGYRTRSSSVYRLNIGGPNKEMPINIGNINEQEIINETATNTTANGSSISIAAISVEWEQMADMSEVRSFFATVVYDKFTFLEV